MATLNTSHHQDGGVLLYQGELILLYCDQVQCEVAQKDTVKGRIYLTTHRVLFTAQPLNQSRTLQSLAAPFSALFDMSLEQPVFGANYIKGKLRTDSSENTSPTTQNVYQFKLKFNRGGAIEFGQAMREASRRVTSMAGAFPTGGYAPPSSFAPNQFYQAPDSVYQPNYPVGFALPTQMFNQTPPPGFVYMYQAPPPYPGLTTAASQAQQPQVAPVTAYAPAYNPQTVGFGSSVEYPIYPLYPQFPPQYPQYGQPGYPLPPQSGQPGYPPQYPHPSQSGQPGYPPQYPQAPQSGQPGYPQPPQSGQPGYQPASSSQSDQSSYPPPPSQPWQAPPPPQERQAHQQASAPYNSNTSFPAYPAYPPTNDYSANGPQNGAPPGYTPLTHSESVKKGN